MTEPLDLADLRRKANAYLYEHTNRSYHAHCLATAVPQLLDEIAAAEQRGRRQAAAQIRTEAAERAATACCEGTGDCGLDDCRPDAAAVRALETAAKIAEESNHAD